MISTGNDIVSLGTANPRTLQPKFYGKILSGTELELFRSGSFPGWTLDRFIWLVWSVKEAVYKFQKRLDPALLFSPLKITIRDMRCPQGHTPRAFGTGSKEAIAFEDAHTCTCTGTMDAAVFFSTSIIYTEFIYSVVNNTDNFDKVCWGVQYINETGYHTQSTKLRSFVLQKLFSVYPGHRLQIEKSVYGYPLLSVNEQITDLPLSFTHHDHFIAYAFVLKT